MLPISNLETSFISNSTKTNIIEMIRQGMFSYGGCTLDLIFGGRVPPWHEFVTE